jgi:hypothetical protein
MWKLMLPAIVVMMLPVIHPQIVRQASAHSCLDVALVLSVDASASVTKNEFALQQKGIASAFRDPAVLDAISIAGRVAVSVIFWGSEGLPKPQSRWMIIGNAAAADGFARMVESMPRDVTGDTGLGSGLLAALQKFDSLGECAIRKVVNVSGDGEETRLYRRMRLSPAPSQVRAIADSKNVEINALAILNEEKNLAAYYATNVVTGPNAFVMQVDSYADFSNALRRKLIREIGPHTVSGDYPKVTDSARLN